MTQEDRIDGAEAIHAALHRREWAKLSPRRREAYARAHDAAIAIRARSVEVGQVGQTEAHRRRGTCGAALREVQGRVTLRHTRFVRVRVDTPGGGHIALGSWPPRRVVRDLERVLAITFGEPCRRVVPGLEEVDAGERAVVASAEQRGEKEGQR